MYNRILGVSHRLQHNLTASNQRSTMNQASNSMLAGIQHTNTAHTEPRRM